ncbi:uncharacterized protein [Epargyreus clarus]
MGDHKEFLKRISKSLYYGQLPSLPCLSLPVTEISCSLWSVAQRGRSLRRLHADAAARIARSACVSPCALVLAILYLERLKRCNPDYLAAAAPSDLFLVSLMVSNKFLQDDGEDDEVICSEWAASGGLEVDQLKKLEIEFLNAIDWNVYVSDKSFEAGLEWLEREVALKQAQLHGFFTYADLAACGARSAAALGGALSAAAALAAAAAALAALLAAALLAPPAAAPLAPAAARAPVDADSNVIPDGYLSPMRAGDSNDTIDATLTLLVDDVTFGELKCCETWTRYRDGSEAEKKWYDGVIVYDWKSFESWWSRTSVLNWLYQSSLIGPMQRWLEKINEYSDFVRNELGLHSPDHLEKCDGYVQFNERQQCIRQWLNLSKLSVMVTSVSDR